MSIPISYQLELFISGIKFMNVYGYILFVMKISRLTLYIEPQMDSILEFIFELKTETFHVNKIQPGYEIFANQQQYQLGDFLEFCSKIPYVSFTVELNNFHPSPFLLKFIERNLTRISTCPDYQIMLSALACLGVIDLEPSSSMMAFDERKLLLDGEWYEVDCLGTDLCKNLSSKVEKLFTQELLKKSKL